MRYAQVVVNTPLIVKVARNVEPSPDQLSVEPAPLDELSSGRAEIDQSSNLPAEPEHPQDDFELQDELIDDSVSPDELFRYFDKTFQAHLESFDNNFLSY